jgi:hypothetical protein
LNRLISKGFSGDLAKTPWSCYQYDTAMNGVGYLAGSWTLGANATQASGCAGVLPTIGALTNRKISAYDVMGRITAEQQCTPGNCNAVTPSPYSLNYAYDYIGNVTHAEDGIGQAVWMPQYADDTGRLTGVSALTTWPVSLYPSQLLSIQSYSPAGGLANWTLGIPTVGSPALIGQRSYDNRLRPVTESVTGHD